MALSTVRVGVYNKQSESDTINGTSNRMRSFGPVVKPTVNAWIEGIGWWGGRDGASSPNVTAAAYTYPAVSGSHARLGMTTEVSTGTSMADASGGTRYERALTTIDGAGSHPRTLTDLPVVNGTPYVLSLLAESQIFRYSATLTGVTSVNPGTTEERGSLTDPPASYTPTTSVTPALQVPTLYMYGYENEPPEAPINTVPSGTEQSLTPTFVSDFRDLNGAYGASSGNGVDSGDYLAGYQIEVRDGSTTGTVMWNQQFDATPAEGAANQMSRVYAGTTLVRGTTYWWRSRHKDVLGDWGDWHAWVSFTVSSRGYVTLDGAPTGKQTVITGITFNGKWTSAQSESTDRVQIRLVGSNGSSVLQTSPEITKSVAHAAAPGTAFTISWAESTFSDLSWATGYYYQIRGRDTSGQWSNWSNPRLFYTDAAPNVPANLSPANNAVWTSFPKLAATVTDTDDGPGSPLTAVFRITRPNLSTVDVTPTYNGTTGKYEFQTTGTELNAFGSYSWRATGYDGTLYTGEATALGSAVFSNPATFQYLSGPAVTITSPADGATVATSSLTVTWTATGQVSRQVRLYDAVSGALVYDSGDTVTASQSFTIPAGSYQNNKTYVLEVSVTNSTPLTGTSSLAFITSYTPATGLSNVQFSTERYELDPVDTGVHISWDQTTYPLAGDPRFVAYSVYRTVLDGTNERRRLLYEENPAVTSFTDPHPPSGVEVFYEVVQSAYTGVDTVDSTPATGTLSIDLGQYHVLSLLTAPTVYRAVLTNVSDKGVADLADMAAYPSLGGGAPITIYGPGAYETRTLSANVIASGSATADQYLAALRDLRGQLGTICYRDGAGTKAYYAIETLQMTAQMGDESGRWYVVALGLREENVTEGELAG